MKIGTLEYSFIVIAPSLLWFEMVVPVSNLSRSEIDLFKKEFYAKSPCAKKYSNETTPQKM